MPKVTRPAVTDLGLNPELGVGPGRVVCGGLARAAQLHTREGPGSWTGLGAESGLAAEVPWSNRASQSGTACG